MAQKKWFQVNDCVSVTVRDYWGWSDTYEGMIIKVGRQITVLFTDGDIEKYGRSDLTLLDANESYAVTEEILEVLECMENQNTKLEQQKAKINALLGHSLT